MLSAGILQMQFMMLSASREEDGSLYGTSATKATYLSVKVVRTPYW